MLKALLSTIPDGVWVVDFDCRLLEVNDEYCRMIGFSREEILTLSIPDLEAAQDREEILRHIAEVVKVQSLRFETRHRRKDGRLLDVEVTAAAVRGTDRLVCFLRDITQRKREAVERARAEERLRFALELGRRARSLTEAEILRLSIEEAVRLTRSRTGHVHYVDDARATLTLAAWAGGPLPDGAAGPGSDVRLAEAGAWADAVRLRRPVVHDEPRPAAWQGWPAGGPGPGRYLGLPVLDRDRVVTIVGVGDKEEPYDDDDAALVLALVADVRHIVLLKRAGDRLHEVEARDRAILSTIPDQMFLVRRADGVVLDCRVPESSRSGMPIDAILGRSVTDLMPPEVAGRLASAFEDAALTGRTQIVEYSEPRPGGVAEREARVSAVDGERLLAIVRDVTAQRQAQTTLRLHAAAVQAAANAIVICDRDGRILFTNPAFSELTGWDREEVLGRTPRLLRSGAQPREFYREMWETILGGKVWRGEITNRRKDGSPYVEEMTITPLLDGEGTVSHFVAIKQDAGWRREAADRLATSERRFHDLVQGLDAIVFEVDPVAKKATFVSEQAESILGYPIQRWLSDETFFLSILHPEDRDALFRRGWVPGLHEQDVRLRAADGRWAWMHGSARFENDGEGRPSRHSGVLIDITEHHELEMAVATAADEWKASFDAMEAALLILDAEDRLVRVNRSAHHLLGADRARCVGRALGEVARGPVWTTAIEAVERARRDGQSGDLSAHDEDGRIWNVGATKLAGTGAWDGRVILSLRDVTAFARLQESVRRSEAMAELGALVGAVAHQVRNPLFAMSVNIDALGAILGDRPDLVEVLQALCRERDRTVRLMDDLLHYGRPTSPVKAPAPLEGVLSAAVAASAPIAALHAASVRRTGGPALRRILMDAGRIEEVFVNLLDNACRHSPKGGVVTLHVSEHSDAEGDWVRCVVTDEGPGFPPDGLARAFEPFFTRRKGGIGLGLAIARRNVLEHGGKVRAENGEGGGAELTVDLPLLEDEAGRTTAP